MSYRITLTSNFKKEAKRLSKKYPSLKTELIVLGKELAENPTLGIALGNSVFKIRLAIASKGRGKSGGARVITYAEVDNQTVLLLSIYNKGEKETITDSEIQALLHTYT